MTAGSKIKKIVKPLPIKDTPSGSFFFRPAILQLQSGVQMKGALSIWATQQVSGEVVFTTGMTGYVETLTDPSYAGQVITFTYPLIGNYGVPEKKYWEHERIAARGAILSEACILPSHYQSRRSLFQWLQEDNIPLFICPDTRALTKIIREQGTPLGVIDFATKNKKSVPRVLFSDPAKSNLIAEVSVVKEKIYGKGKKTIIAVDCGMKENIIREFLQYDTTIIRVPYDYDYTKKTFDGVFVSNGPGDPSQAMDTIKILQRAMVLKKPIFGICLGSQLMGHAAGAKTYKLPYGHRGQNQPCKNLSSGRCYLTSQNHGYAVDEKTLPKDWIVTFRNLNDNSVEGISHKKLPFFSVQFHPEASPGPTDSTYLFKEFIDLL
ncbi:glutamine-hydrolyzing carbamoyl-phosphate synthase small subunit [Candidatus Uhrbacteria bacterium]|nr:glutamine-hydrolyzing carbamoyl-phosphate synthase small subunit [Candidatus Uhrbacteria bacterium]